MRSLESLQLNRYTGGPVRPMLMGTGVTGSREGEDASIPQTVGSWEEQGGLGLVLL